MKIIRDGKEFELTFSELMQAHEEYELDCMIADVNEKYEDGEYDVELTDKQIEQIASLALHNLGKNDSYFEAYWASVECTLEDYIDNIVDHKEDK